MQDIADRSAARLRQNDTYQNRTGELRRTTRTEASIAGNGDAIVTLAMEQEYASFVKNLGYSRFDEEALAALLSIRALIAKKRRQIHAE